VSDEYSAFIFRIEISIIRMQLSYKASLQPAHKAQLYTHQTHFYPEDGGSIVHLHVDVQYKTRPFRNPEYYNVMSKAFCISILNITFLSVESD
jgi:hypothetical protein